MCATRSCRSPRCWARSSGRSARPGRACSRRRPGPARRRWCRSTCSARRGWPGSGSSCSSRAGSPPAPRRGAWRRCCGERVGDTVGYRVRCETRVGPRHAHRGRDRGHADAHAPARSVARRRRPRHLRRVPRAQPGRRPRRSRSRSRRATCSAPDLRVLVMSATLDGARVARLLGDAPVITSEGRAFPVETPLRRAARPSCGSRTPSRGRSARARRPTTATSSSSCPAPARSGASRPAGERDAAAADARVMPLHGNLPREAQDARSARAAPGRAQGRARDVDRRDEPDDRGRARRDRQRAVARPAILAAHGHDAAGDGARIAGLGRPAARTRRTRRARRVLSAVGREEDQRRSSPHRRPRSGGGSRTARAGAGRVGRRRSRRAGVARSAARRRRTRRRASCWSSWARWMLRAHHRARPADGGAAAASAPRPHAAARGASWGSARRRSRWRQP